MITTFELIVLLVTLAAGLWCGWDWGYQYGYVKGNEEGWSERDKWRLEEVPDKTNKGIYENNYANSKSCPKSWGY